MGVKLLPQLRATLGDDRYERAVGRGKALSRAEAISRLDPAALG